MKKHDREKTKAILCGQKRNRLLDSPAHQYLFLEHRRLHAVLFRALRAVQQIVVVRVAFALLAIALLQIPERVEAPGNVG